MSTGLFDETNLLKIEYQQNLKRLELDLAFQKLTELAEKLKQRRDISPKISAFETFIRMVSERRGECEKLAVFTLELSKNESLKPLVTDFQYIREGLMNEIAGLLPADQYNYITPYLHPAEVFLELLCFEKAVTAVSLYIENRGEDALLRQVQGLTYFKQEERGMARRNLSLALFHNPCRCREEYLFPEDVKKELKSLIESSDSIESAWLALPVELWKKKTISIIDDVGFEDHLKELTYQDRPYKNTDPLERGLRFLRLLYLAELCRLRCKDIGQLEALRRQMKEVDKDKFDDYMAFIS